MIDDEHTPDPNLQTPYNMAQQRKSEPSPGEQAYEFFKNILEPDTEFTFAEFQKHWNAIEKSDLSSRKLTAILSRAVAVLEQLDQKDQKELSMNCRSEMMFHFGCWEKPATKQIPYFDQYDLASCLRNYRILSRNPSDKFMRAWYKHADPKSTIRGAKHEQRLVNSIVSFGVGRLKPTEIFYKEWIPKALDGMAYFRPRQLSMVLWPFARFTDEPIPEILDEWEDQFDHLVKRRLNHFKQRDVANIIGSCSALHAITGNWRYKAIAEKTRPLIDFKECDLPAERQLWYAHLWFDWEYPLEPPKSDETPSDVELKLTELFAKHGYPTHDEGYKIPILNHKPDNNLVIDGKTVLTEVDGKSHFLVRLNERTGEPEEAGFIGRTLFMSALAKKYADEAVFVRIPSKLCIEVFDQSPEEQERFVKNFVEEIQHTNAGAFHLRRRRPEAGNDNTAERPLITRPLKIASMQPDSLS